MGFIAALSALWSPFVTIGLAPVVAAAILNGRWRTLWTFPNIIAGPALLFVSAVFLKTVERDKIVEGFIWQFYPVQSVAFRWPLFCLGEFGVYALLLFPAVMGQKLPRNQRHGLSREWFLIAILALLVLPVYRIGEWNDLCMRASIPCLFLFWIVLLRMYFSGALPLNSWRGAVLVGCLLVSSAFPAKNWVDQVIHTRPRLQFFDGSADVSVTDLLKERIPQYLGRADRFFFRFLAPPTTKVQQAPPKMDQVTARVDF